MPLFMAPKPEANTKTRKVTPPGWETTGPLCEFFEILEYTDPAVVRAAQKAGRESTVNGNGRTAEETNRAAYLQYLFALQLKGWRVLVAPGVPATPETMEEEDGYLFWKFTPKNVADLPWDLQDWVEEQIRLRGGATPTSALVTKADDGTLLDFRSSVKQLV